MHHFFTTPEEIGEEYIRITGPDVNHIRNVLRMKLGETMLISDGQGKDYCCELAELGESEVLAKITDAEYEGTEPVCEFYLFQGLPKSDKMELIVQKAVELGVKEIIPVATKRAVVKLDEKKAQKKQERWQLIAKGAAEQSGRGVIPEVCGVCSFTEALEQAESLDVVLIPYELEEGMAETVRVIEQIEPGQSVGIFIGPEGGFEEAEVLRAKEKGARPVTLGKRILRTETAGLTTLSILMYHIESRAVSPKREES